LIVIIGERDEAMSIHQRKQWLQRTHGNDWSINPEYFFIAIYSGFVEAETFEGHGRFELGRRTDW
jgi:hypothetical protein